MTHLLFSPTLTNKYFIKLKVYNFLIGSLNIKFDK